MPRRLLVPLLVVLAVVALAFLGAAYSAPAPKEPPAIKTPKGGIAAEPAEVADEEAAERLHKASSNNLKQIALAFHNFHDTYNEVPADITDKDGKPLLSWRVQLLPFIEQDNLYKQFNRDEAWDSPHNKPLLAKMPAVFASPRVKLKEAGHTTYLGFAGPGAMFEPGKKLQMASITDGLSNTIFAVESSTAYPWTRPIDLPFDPKMDPPAFGKAYKNVPLCAMCDGSTRSLDLTKISPTTLKAAITVAGGEVLGSDW
jgi:hypothetical protein